jgi:hypothetical protein
MDAMGNRNYFLAAVLFLVALSAALNARADDQRINLRYPGWALSLDRQVSLQREYSEQSRTLSLRLSGSELLPQTGWRLPLRESMFLSLDATFSTQHVNPAHPSLARPAFQAGVGVGVEF